MYGNSPGDGYIYKVTVFTGVRRGAGTKSNVSILLSGDKDDSGAKMLEDGQKSVI